MAADKPIPDWLIGVGFITTVLVLAGLFVLWLLVRARDVVAAEREEEERASSWQRR